MNTIDTTGKIAQMGYSRMQEKSNLIDSERNQTVQVSIDEFNETREYLKTHRHDPLKE